LHRLLKARIGYNSNGLKTIEEMQAGVENVLYKNYHDHLDWGNKSRSGRNIYALFKYVF